MRLTFDETGRCRGFYGVTPKVPGPDAPWVTIDVEYPDYFVAGVERAFLANRISMVAGKVCLDGKPYTPPVPRTPVSYTRALAAVQNATSVSQLREILYRVCDEFLSIGALEL
jgi:hypothetical protein